MAVTKDDVTSSLKEAANAAHDAFTAAALIDPVAAKPLWIDSINATNAFLQAMQQQLAGEDADIKAAQDALDAQTKKINIELQNLKDIATATQVVGQLISLIASVAKFFA
jgi:hypothetical protein